MKKYLIWTKDDVEHKVLGYTKGDAISQFIKNNSYILEEVMYVVEDEDEDI